MSKPIKQTREAIEKLKIDWRRDPEWNIEETEGFAAHKEELLIFRLQTEIANRESYEKRTAIQLQRLGLGNSETLLYYLQKLEERIERIENKFNIY